MPIFFADNTRKERKANLDWFYRLSLSDQVLAIDLVNPNDAWSKGHVLADKKDHNVCFDIWFDLHEPFAFPGDVDFTRIENLSSKGLRTVRSEYDKYMSSLSKTEFIAHHFKNTAQANLTGFRVLEDKDGKETGKLIIRSDIFFNYGMTKEANELALADKDGRLITYLFPRGDVPSYEDPEAFMGRYLEGDKEHFVFVDVLTNADRLQADIVVNDKVLNEAFDRIPNKTKFLYNYLNSYGYISISKSGAIKHVPSVSEAKEIFRGLSPYNKNQFFWNMMYNSSKNRVFEALLSAANDFGNDRPGSGGAAAAAAEVPEPKKTGMDEEPAVKVFPNLGVDLDRRKERKKPKKNLGVKM